MSRGSIGSATKSSMNPQQHNVRGHLADDARIMPIACQRRIGFVAVGKQRGSTFHVGVYEGFDRGKEFSEIIARRMRPERVSRYLACLRRGLA